MIRRRSRAKGLPITKPGVALSFGAASAAVSMPTDGAGGYPIWVRLAATAPCYVRLGFDGLAAVAGDAIVRPGNSVVMRAAGFTHIAAVQVSGAGVLQLSPLDLGYSIPSGAPSAPVWNSAPTILAAVVGQATAVSVAGLSGNPFPALTYQWKLNGSNVSGATASTYTPVSGDIGGTLTVTVTATNGSGTAASTSNGVTVAAVVAALYEDDGTTILYEDEGSTALLEDSAAIPVTLVIFAGQSNSIGWSQDSQNTTALTGGLGYEFRDAAGGGGAWLPLGRTLLGRTQGGPHCAFAQTWAAGGGGTVLCVNVGVNGASMISAIKQAQSGNIATQGYESLGGGTWDLSDVASHYTVTGGAKDIITKAIASASAAGFSLAKKVVVWVQGETDAQANQTAATYSPKLSALIDRFVSDFAIDGFFISALGVASASPPAAWAAIRQGQTDSAAARPSVATMAFTGAPAFFAAGKNITGDELHYTQAGYNEMGAGLATGGLSFLGGLALAAPPASIYGAILANPPALARWKRMILTTTRSGAISPQVYSGGISPVAPTFYDASGTNRMQGGNPSWTYPSSAAKQLCLYMSDQASAPTIVGGGNLSVTAISIPDDGFKCGSFNWGSSGDAALGMSFPEADMLRMNAAALSFVGLSSTDPDNTVAITDAVLTRFTNLTQASVSRSDTAASVNWGIRPALTFIALQQVGYTTAEVNQVLQTIDAGGGSGSKTLAIEQFRSSPAIAAAPPSGAGLTAKNSLIAKGWSVTTD